MDSFVKLLAQIKAAELLPMIKNIYKEYHVPSTEIKSGVKGVTRQLTKGTDEKKILVRAVGWEGYHLHQFVNGRNYYTLPDENGSTDYGEDARMYTIGDLMTRVGAKLKWEYDFGDS